MSRSRDLANLANNATGLETLTVSDITDLTATATELNYVDGVGSALQAQIDAKLGSSGTFNGTIGSSATFPADSVVQFIWDYTNTVSTITNTSAPGDSWLEKPITLKYSNSKILISVSFTYAKQDSYTGYTRLYRDTSGGSNTWIYPNTSDRGYSLRGGPGGWGHLIGFIQYVDTPGSGTHTYKCYSYTTDSGYPMYINKNYNNSQDGHSGGTASSSIVLMEIKV